MRCFVTVGSTEFDALVAAVLKSDCLKTLKQRGITDLLIQMGKGEIEPEKGNHEGVNVDFYRYKDDILSDIAGADLVIGHAGAGTTLEVLRHRKPLVVVINEELMDNHQRELAERFASLGHALCTVPAGLTQALRSRQLFRQKPFDEPDYEWVAAIISGFVGIVD